MRPLVSVLASVVSVSTFILSANSSFAQAPKVLKIWHYESKDSAMGKAWDQAIKEFEASHPGIKVKLEIKGFEQIRQTASMALNSDEVPDVMEYNKGNASAGLLSSQGLLSDLTEAATKRGWDKILSPSLQTTCRYNKKGIMGSGSWFGVTNYGEYVMAYYNKDLFKKHNQKVPTNLDELEKSMAVFKKAGITPLAIGAAEYPAQQVFYELALSKASRPLLNAFQLYQGNFDFQGPEFTFAAQKLQEWVKNGYISKTATGQKAENMGLEFTGGKLPIVISGSWWYGRFMTEIKGFDWGVFLFPGNKFHPGSGGNLWVVPTRAKNKELAYDFIDITMKKELQTTLGNAGGVPVNADLSKITDPKINELIQNFSKIVQQDGLAFYPDWPASGFYDALVAATQELVLGKPPAQILKTLNGAYNDNKPQ